MVDVTMEERLASVGLHQVLVLAQEMVDMGIGFVGCQKCVHPRVRELLEINVRVMNFTLLHDL